MAASKKELGASLRKRLAYLDENRRAWLSDCSEISRHIVPERGRFSKKPGLKKTDRASQYNSRPDKYLHNLASMLQSGLTSPARPWFRLTLQDTDMNEWGAAKEWLTQVENIFERIFRSSDFYPAIHSAYIELAAFGAAALGSWEDERDFRRGFPQFASYTAGEWYAGVNSIGETDAVFRNVYMSAREAFARFGKECSEALIKLASEEPYASVKIIHCVEKRDNFDPDKKDCFNMPYASVWLEYDGDKTKNEGVLGIGGFTRMPYHICRWNALSDDPYGSGPGHKAVKDAKSLNILDQIATYGLNKAVNPPILVPAHLNVKLNNAPGGVTFFAGNGADNQIRPLYTIGADLNAALTFMNRWEDILKETFQNDLFIYLLNRPGVTATEIYERNEEKLLLLGPVLERIQTELLMPVFERVYLMLEKNSLLPAPPAELIGMDLKPEFTGLLAQAQKAAATQGIRNAASFAGELASVSPQVLDKVDFDQALDIYSSMMGVPTGMIRSDEETENIREKARREKQAALEAQGGKAALNAAIEAAGKLSEIDTGKRSALKDIIGL